MSNLAITRSLAPYLLYDDLASAVTWLSCAFAFREVLRHEEGGELVHVEMAYGDDRLMLVSASASAARGLGRPAPAIVHVAVDDLDRHFVRAQEAMARVVIAPRDAWLGQREYCVEDPQGHRWLFAQQVRDVPAEVPREPRPAAARVAIGTPRPASA